MNITTIKNYITNYNNLINKPISDEALTGWIYFGTHPVYSVDYATVMSDMTNTQNLLNSSTPNRNLAEMSYTDSYLPMATAVTGDTFVDVVVTDPQPDIFYIAEVIVQSSLLNREYTDPIEGGTTYEEYNSETVSVVGLYSIETGFLIFLGSISSIGIDDVDHYTLHELQRV
jgi:hypothetical protein